MFNTWSGTDAILSTTVTLPSPCWRYTTLQQCIVVNITCSGKLSCVELSHTSRNGNTSRSSSIKCPHFNLITPSIPPRWRRGSHLSDVTSSRGYELKCTRKEDTVSLYVGLLIK